MAAVVGRFNKLLETDPVASVDLAAKGANNNSISALASLHRLSKNKEYGQWAQAFTSVLKEKNNYLNPEVINLIEDPHFMDAYMVNKKGKNPFDKKEIKDVFTQYCNSETKNKGYQNIAEELRKKLDEGTDNSIEDTFNALNNHKITDAEKNALYKLNDGFNEVNSTDGKARLGDTGIGGVFAVVMHNIMTRTRVSRNNSENNDVSLGDNNVALDSRLGAG